MNDRPIANPFNNGIVPDAWVEPVVDVPSIHADVSGLCLQLLDEVARHRKRRSILIHGAAGSGKTHTLSRMRSAAISAAIRPQPLFSYVRLTTSSSMIRRHLRHSLARDLARKNEQGIPHLESLLIDSLTKEMGKAPDQGELERFGESPGACGAICAAFDEMCTRLGIDYHVACACRLFLLRRHRHAVIHWLETGELPDGVRAELGCDVGTRNEETTDAEHSAFAVTLQLISLATDTRPLLLCFDQLEAMQISAEDRTGYFAYGKLAADLFDHCEGILLITCVQTSAMEPFTQAVPAHDLHRIAQYEKQLTPLTDQQARDLIRARLDSSPTLRAEPRRRGDPLWPVGEERFRQFLTAADATPRRLCALGREAFLKAHHMPREINDYLSAIFEQRRSWPLESTALGDELVHGLAMLLAARGFGVSSPDDREDFDLLVMQPPRRIWLSVLNDEGTTLTHRLRQIVERQPAGQEERVLVREARRPIPMTAKKAWEYWGLLTDEGRLTEAGVPRVRAVTPTTEVIASLEAVRSIVSDSRAGDLESHGESVPPPVVEAWIREQLRDEGLDRLVAEIEHGSPGGDAASGPAHRQARDTALEILQHRHVMLIDDLAAAARCDIEEMRMLLAADASTFGTLGSPPLLVFDRSLPVS